MRAARAVCVLGLAGCGQLTGLDDYSIAYVTRASGYLDSPECRACVDAKCKAEEDACDADPLCRDTLACRRQCTDPACHWDCTYPENDERAWSALAPPQPSDGALAACALDHCRGVCSVGRSFDCVEQYDWEQRRSADLVVRERLFDLSGGGWDSSLANLSVKVCGRGDVSCTKPLADGIQTENDGTIEVTLLGSVDPEIYIAVEETLDFPGYVIFNKTRPRYSGEYQAYGLTDRIHWSEGLKEVGLDLATHGLVSAQFYDCAGLYAGGLVVEIQALLDGKLAPCESCTVAYIDQGYLPNFDDQYTNPYNGSAVVVGIEPGFVQVSAKDRISGLPVARVKLDVRAGVVNTFGAMPLTSSAD